MLSIIFSVIILITGIYFTFKSGFVQFFRLKDGFRYMLDDKFDQKGNISAFSALCTTLAATLGTGNIVGVSVSLCMGGPGALFWMIISGFFGMSLSYAEGYLAVKFRIKKSDGSFFGGPFCYMEKGMGKKYKPLAVIYTVFAVAAGVFGIGTTVQVNSATCAVDDFFDTFNPLSIITPFGEYSLPVIICGLLITLSVALVIAGGIGRIAAFSTVAVPVMSVFYMFFVIFAVLNNIAYVPEAFYEIIKGAVNPSAVTGGVVGSITKAFTSGVTKGVFSNEAGLGTGAISASASRTSSCEHQGSVCMIATFVDTVVMCSLTGLAVVVTDAWKITDASGAYVTGFALAGGCALPESVVSFVLMLSLIFFAFTSIVGWCCYCESCVRYLFGNSKNPIYVFRTVYIASVFCGAYFKSESLWSFADVLNTFMAVPNIIALIYLRNKIKY